MLGLVLSSIVYAAAVAPAIDGDASAPVWKTAKPFEATAGVDATTVRFLEVDGYLYAGIHALQREHIAASVLADDRSIDSDDTITLTFVGTNGPLTFRVNPLGTHDGYSGEWKSAGRVLQNAYDVTLRIPRSLLEKDRVRTLVVSRRIAASNQTISSATVPVDFAQPAAQYQAAHIVAGDRGTFGDKFRALWPGQAPDIPADAAGVAVKSTHQGVTVVALDAHTQAREDTAQTVAYTTPDNRLSARAMRIEVADSSKRDVLQSVSLNYQNGDGLIAGGGVAVDESVNGDEKAQGNFTFTNLHYHANQSTLDFFWSAVGAAYDPLDEFGTSAGTTNYSAQAAHAFGAVSLNASAQASHDDVGNLVTSQDEGKVSLQLTDALALSANVSADYDQSIGAYNENGAGVSLKTSGASAEASYRFGHYAAGLLQDARAQVALPVGRLGSLDVSHRQTNLYAAGAPESVQQSTSVGIKRSSSLGSVRVGYQFVNGALPWFVREGVAAGGSAFISLDRNLGLGMLHLNFNESSSAFAATRTFSVKFVPGA